MGQESMTHRIDEGGQTDAVPLGEALPAGEGSVADEPADEMPAAIVPLEGRLTGRLEAFGRLMGVHGQSHGSIVDPASGTH